MTSIVKLLLNKTCLPKPLMPKKYIFGSIKPLLKCLPCWTPVGHDPLAIRVGPHHPRGPEAVAGDGGVRVPRFSCIYPLPDPPPGSKVGPFQPQVRADSL